jgi:hypothetical protein
MSLHGQIMNLPCKFQTAWNAAAPSGWVEGYVNGHRDTRHAAADLALTADEQIRKLREALEQIANAEPDPLDMKFDAFVIKQAASLARAALKETE